MYTQRARDTDLSRAEKSQFNGNGTSAARSINPFRRFQASPRDLLSRPAPFSLRAPLSPPRPCSGEECQHFYPGRVSGCESADWWLPGGWLSFRFSLYTGIWKPLWSRISGDQTNSKLTRWHGAKGSRYSEEEAPHASGRLTIDDR